MTSWEVLNHWISNLNNGQNQCSNQTVSLKVYDLSGKLMYQTSGNVEAGMHQFDIDGKAIEGTGVYFYEIANDTNRIVKRMVKIQ